MPERITRLHFTDGSPRAATTEKRHPFYDKIQKRWCVKIGKPAKVVRFKERSEAEAALEQARKKEWINIVIDQDLNADPRPRRRRRWVPEQPERHERIAMAAHVTEQADQPNDEEKAADDLEREREAHDEADMTKIESIEARDADWTELSRSLGGIPRR